MPPRGKVVWKKHDGMQAKRESLPHPLLPLERHDSEEYLKAAHHLYVGSLWTNVERLMIDNRFTLKGYKQHEHKYLIQCFHTYSHSTSQFPVGKHFVYIGPVRVEEANSKGEKLRVSRHAFLVDGVVYMVLHPEMMLTPVQVEVDS